MMTRKGTGTSSSQQRDVADDGKVSRTLFYWQFCAVEFCAMPGVISSMQCRFTGRVPRAFAADMCGRLTCVSTVLACAAAASSHQFTASDGHSPWSAQGISGGGPDARTPDEARVNIHVHPPNSRCLRSTETLVLSASDCEWCTRGHDLGLATDAPESRRGLQADQCLRPVSPIADNASDMQGGIADWVIALLLTPLVDQSSNAQLFTLSSLHVFPSS